MRDKAGCGSGLVARFRSSGRGDRIILLVLVAGFLGATWNHAMDLVRGGFLPYARMWGVPAWMNWYWTLLTLLDPLAILALAVSVPSGRWLYLAVMASDVAVNLYANTRYWRSPVWCQYGLLMQASFLVFLLAVFGRLGPQDRRR